MSDDSEYDEDDGYPLCPNCGSKDIDEIADETTDSCLVVYVCSGCGHKWGNESVLE